MPDALSTEASLPLPFFPIQMEASSFFRPCSVPKKFQDSPSHRILWHMHKVLNIDKNKYWLHSLPVIRELNLLSLVSPWSDESDTVAKTKNFPQLNNAINVKGFGADRTRLICMALSHSINTCFHSQHADFSASSTLSWFRPRLVPNFFAK